MTLINGVSSTEVLIDTTGIAIGEYTLFLESFDLTNHPSELVLKSDKITIMVIEAVCSLTQADFDSASSLVANVIELAASKDGAS